MKKELEALAEHRDIKKLRHMAEMITKHEIDPTLAELPGNLEFDSAICESCDTCVRQEICMQRHIPFHENGCSSYWSGDGFERYRMVILNDIHITLCGDLTNKTPPAGIRFESLEDLYRSFGHIPTPYYSIRAGEHSAEFLLWGRQVIGSFDY